MADSEKYKNLNELKMDIANWYNSIEYNRLSSLFQKTDIFKILGISRKEERHSKFIAWLLDPEGSHGLGDFPLRNFFRLLAISKAEYMNTNSEFPAHFEKSFLFNSYSFDRNKCIKVETERSIPAREKISKNKKGKSNDRLDILIDNITIIENGRSSDLFVVIENKVNAAEGDGQTDHYYNWAHGSLKSGNDQDSNPPKGEPICVFLYPGAMNTKCNCEKYIKITYQNLADMVIEPCLDRSNSEAAKFYISEYLNTLSYSSEDEGGMTVMAFSKEEKELCEEFYKKNEKILKYVIEVLEDSDDVDEGVSAFVKTQNSPDRDRTKYSFNNGTEKYVKRKLALKIFQEASKTKNIDELKDIIQRINLKKNAIIDFNDYAKIEDKTRYFGEVDKRIRIGEKEYCLTNQWGKSANGDGPFEKLLAIAREELNFDIKEITE